MTFLFTDIEGSTRLWQEHPDAMRAGLARHDDIVRSAIEAHAGHVVKTTGDGFHAAFAAAADALGSALDAQRALHAEAWNETGPLKVRMGLHTGETQARDGDYYGPAVNRAARVMAVAHGGQIVCSRTTVEVVADAFPVRSLGEHRLRDLGAAQELFQVGPGEFPPLRSLDVVPTNLPTVRTELIGRSDDVRALAEFVGRERLVTLTGVGGVGKTRLALAVAAQVAVDFADGCWLVDLAPVGAGEDVVTAVVGSVHAPATDLDALAAYLADRRMLLVLDNCEHVLDAVADLVDRMLAEAADVHVIATSREPLGLDGEHVRRVQSLGVPGAAATLDEARAFPAVRLFAERAAAAAGGFAVDAESLGAVVEICSHLDGIPLAIELAAARVGAMSPAQIAGRLDERFRLLSGGSRRAQERHRTLLATVSWSHDLLSEPERVVFRRLAVFPASFDLDAAEVVAQEDGVDVVECVLQLVNRSLVAYEADRDRYRMLETLRQFAADRLGDAGETDPIRTRHARRFLELAERWGPAVDGPAFASARAALFADLDNLRATAEWCTVTGWWAELAELCAHVWTFLEQETPAEGAAWLQDVIDHGGALDRQAVADALGVLAWIQVSAMSDLEGAERAAAQSVAIAEEARLVVSPWAWNARAQAGVMIADYAESMRAAERGLEAATARGDERGAVVALCFQTSALPGLGEAGHTNELAEEVLDRAERTGNPVLIVAVLVSWSSGYLRAVAEPDYAASFGILTRHAELHSGGINDMWLDLHWGMTLLGLDRPGAVERAAAAARAADRFGALHALAESLLLLAIVAAEAGRWDQAGTLVAYRDSELRQYTQEQPGSLRMQARLDRAMSGAAEARSARPTRPTRSEIMALVNELDAIDVGS